ncbi:MAG TPA: hypothetical protein VM529_05535 [Gemmata sp.]|nr:hypothetical protein [Gemmata sp.]
MTDDEFLATFEAAAFARPEWTHEAHVRMAWLYLSRLPFAEAVHRVRTGIQKLNAKIGSPDGYHETITVAFVRVIADRATSGEDYPAFRDHNPDLFDRTLTALLHHYTKERLYSAEARKEFIEPDVRPLPRLDRARS